MRRIFSLQAVLFALLVAPCLSGCDTPSTTVVVENDYRPSTTDAFVIYRAFWQAVSFDTPLVPGTSSAPKDTVAASANEAYVLLAPGWDPTSATAPTRFIVLQSVQGFDVHFNSRLRIPVDDVTFAGNCTSGTPLGQAEADFITERVFAADFAGLQYDATTCTTTGAP
jgi:hypothetical protein